MQQRSVLTRRRLVRAAAESFDRLGYANATLEEICGQAQLTKGALYFHFGSKGELADAVREDGRTQLALTVEELMARSGSPLQTLIDATHWLAQRMRDDSGVRANFRLTRENGGERSAATDFYQLWMSTTWSLLSQARAMGEIRADIPEPGPQTLVAATVCGVETMAGTGMAYEELAERVASLWELVLPCLVTEGRRGTFTTGAPDLLAAAATPSREGWAGRSGPYGGVRRPAAAPK